MSSIPLDSQLLVNNSPDSTNDMMPSEMRKSSNVSTQPIVPSSIVPTGGPSEFTAPRDEMQNQSGQIQPKSSVVLFAGYRQQISRGKERERRVDEEGISSKPFKRKKRGFFAQLFSSISCCFHSSTLHRGTDNFYLLILDS